MPFLRRTSACNWDRESQCFLTGNGEIFLWAVVYDSIGGVTWAGIGAVVEELE